MLVNQTASLLSCVLHSWNYVYRKARLQRYQEISLSFYTIHGWQNQCHRSQFIKRMRHKQLQCWFKNLSDEAAIIFKHRKSWKSYICQYVVQRKINVRRNLFRQMFVSKQMKLKQLQFWFRNLQEEAAIVQKRKNRQLWDSYFSHYPIKRFFHFWTNYYETIHGLPCIFVFGTGLWVTNIIDTVYRKYVLTGKDWKYLIIVSQHGRQCWKSKIHVFSISRTPFKWD